jgi:hypothetical protein
VVAVGTIIADRPPAQIRTGINDTAPASKFIQVGCLDARDL